MTELTAEIRKFLTRNVFTSTKSGECREIVLKHYSVAGGKSTSEVRHWDIEDHHRQKDGLDALILEVEQTMTAEAATLKGIQKYVLYAFHGKNERATERKIVSLEGGDANEDELESEPATPKGLLAQQMRHNEVIMKTAMMGVASAMTTLQKQLAAMNQRNEDLERDKLNNMQLFVEVATAKHEREMEVMRVTQRDQTIKQLMGKIGPLVPIIAQKLTGRELMPAPVKEIMSGFFETLTPEQKMQIFNALNDEQKAVMAEIFSVMQQ